MRTVKTASGATAVQIVYWSRGGSRRIEHLGSAHDDAELEALKAAARERLTHGQGVLDLGLDPQAASSSGLSFPPDRGGFGYAARAVTVAAASWSMGDFMLQWL